MNLAEIEEIKVDVRYSGDSFRYCLLSIKNVSKNSLYHNIEPLHAKGELSIGINNGFCSLGAGLRFRDQNLAERYIQKHINKWKDKWGQDVQIDVVFCLSSGRREFFTVLEHTDIVLTRLKM